MADQEEGSPKKRSIESLSDLIFGLALSIGAITLIGQPPSDLQELLLSIVYYAFSFMILISVWYSYTRTMSELHIETSSLVNLNILLLFLVSIEPFLFDQLMHSNAPLVEYISMVYALDLGGLFVIQALLANSILTDKNKPEQILQSYKLRRNTLLISAALFFISALPFFWSWSIPIISDAGITLGSILWLIPLTMPIIRRLWERKIKQPTNNRKTTQANLSI